MVVGFYKMSWSELVPIRINDHICFSLADLPFPAEGNNFFVDNRCLLLLLSAMCHKYLGNWLQAERLFQDAISCEKELVTDHYLIPYATYELGVFYWGRNDMNLATVTLENAK